MAKKTLLTVDETGAVLGVSRATVWRMIGRHQLASVRERGRRWVVNASLPQHSNGVRPRRRYAPFTPENPIFRLAGAFRSAGEPGSGGKHAILDE